MKNLYQVMLFGLLMGSAGCAQSTPAELRTPEGFVIETLNFAVPNARQMALTKAGNLIVGTRRRGAVYAVIDPLGPSPEVRVLFDAGLKMPSGITVDNNDLYIGAVSTIIKVPNIDANLRKDPGHEVITDRLPTEGHHGWKYLKFGPDNMLYVPVGAPCNICLEQDPRFASLLRMDPKTGDTEVWASGIRNTVGFAWHPQTQDLWFTDNGRDMLGDDVPPEELNRVQTPGQHFGYPFIHADGIKDPEFGSHNAAADTAFTAPELEIQAHSAALGMAYNTEEQFPAAYKDALFIAEHGSWNRSKKVGYRVVTVTEASDGSLQYAPFVEGWLTDEAVSGRPNDVLFAPDGSLLISDDDNGVIYRVSYPG
ncbi:MAG: PQQ-dependent sugar dehydrogenase [Pseudomonadota bacterium]